MAAAAVRQRKMKAENQLLVMGSLACVVLVVCMLEYNTWFIQHMLFHNTSLFTNLRVHLFRGMEYVNMHL